MGNHIWVTIYGCPYVGVHIWVSIYGFQYNHVHIHVCRGYGSDHVQSETESDGDGGPASKLRGKGHIEFSKKGIPHGATHFVEQIKSAGHIYMHDTCAPEASHGHVIKRAMDRVRKGIANKTDTWMIDWVWRVRTWAEIIGIVNANRVDKTPTPRQHRSSGVIVSNRYLIRPHDAVRGRRVGHESCSPLRPGGNDLISPEARISYHEVTHIYARTYMNVHI